MYLEPWYYRALLIHVLGPVGFSGTFTILLAKVSSFDSMEDL